MIFQYKRSKEDLTIKMALYHGLCLTSLTNDDQTIHELRSVPKLTEGSLDVCKENNDLQRLILSKKNYAKKISLRRNKQFSTYMYIKLSKLISKSYKNAKMRHQHITLFQGLVKKKKINIIVFFPYKIKSEMASKEIMKIQRCLLSITFTNAEKISKVFETHIYYVPRKVKFQLREKSLETNCASNSVTIKNSLLKPFNNCVKKASPRAPIIETGLLKPCENTSLTNLRPHNNLFEIRNSSFLLSGKEEFYLVKRIHLIYIMSKSKKCPPYPTCSKKNFRSSKSHCVSNIFEQSCKVHNQLLKKSAMPCCGHMDSFIKKKRCIEKDYEHMLRQISKLMRTCKSENFKVRETSKHCYPKLPKKPKCKKEIVPLCENCKKSLKVKPKNICKPKCNFGKILKSTYNRCSKQAKRKLKNNNVGKVIKDTYGQCTQKAKMKLKTIHLDRIIKKLYGQCSQQVSSKLKTKLKPTKQDCYMFSVHIFPNQKLEREPKMCQFKENAVFQFWSIMNPEQSKIVNCAAISKRDTNIKNNTSIFEIQQRNYLKSKLLLIKKTTSVVFVDVNNFTEYDICLQGMFKNPSKGSHKSAKSISFDIPEDNGSSHSCVESWQPQHACIENCQDTDEPKCILCDNRVNQISNECKSNLCNAKTSPIKVKLPLPKCIDCTRDNKQCDMGLNTLPQNIEEEYRPIINSKTPRIIRRQKITSTFPPDCIIEINNSGKDLRSLELLDCFQQLKKDGQQGRNKKFQRPFWIKIFQKITKKRKTSKKKLRKTSKELNKSFLKDDKNSNKILTFSDFKKMNAQQLVDIICELKKATCCDSPRKLIEEDGTSSESKSSNSFFGKGSKFSDDTSNSSSDSFSSYDSGSERKQNGINFSIPPNVDNSKKLYRFFCAK